MRDVFCCAAVTALVDCRKATGGRLVLVGAGVLVCKVLGVLDLASAFEGTDRTPP